MFSSTAFFVASILASFVSSQQQFVPSTPSCQPNEQWSPTFNQCVPAVPASIPIPSPPPPATSSSGTNTSSSSTHESDGNYHIAPPAYSIHPPLIGAKARTHTTNADQPIVAAQQQIQSGQVDMTDMVPTMAVGTGGTATMSAIASVPTNLNTGTANPFTTPNTQQANPFPFSEGARIDGVGVAAAVVAVGYMLL